MAPVPPQRCVPGARQRDRREGYAGTTTYHVLVESKHAYPLSPLAAALYEWHKSPPNGTIVERSPFQPGASSFFGG